jgi:hypothetical protein
VVLSDAERVYVQTGIQIVNQSFTFDVRELKTAQIAVQVSSRRVLGIEESLGRINTLCVLNLLEVKFCNSTVPETEVYSSSSGSRFLRNFHRNSLFPGPDQYDLSVV